MAIETTLKTRIVLRHGTSQQWASPNAKPLMAGEVGIDLDKGIIKIGRSNGSPWESSIDLSVKGLSDLRDELYDLSSQTN